MVGAFELFHLIFRIIVDHNAERSQDAHCPGRMFIEILAHAMLKQGDINQVVVFSHAYLGAEFSDGLGRISPAPHSRHGGHTRIIPAFNIFFLNQFNKPALAENRITQIEAGEFDLPRAGPVISFSTIQSYSGRLFSNSRVQME